LIGRPLIGLNFNQQRYEADFRFNLVRVRENSEQIALLSGDRAERGRLLDRFAYVMTNWYAIMTQTKRLTAFTAGYQQISTVFPYIVVSPAYFTRAIPLGVLTQTASAFSSVQNSLSFFVTAYRSIAEWRAVIARLDGFQAAVEAGHRVAVTPPVIAVEAGDASNVAVRQLELRLPNGQTLAHADGVRFMPRERVLVTGPSGSGKSTFFRAIAGIWPFGTGSVTVPRDARLMVLPQRPYLPIGSLHAAIAYPAAPDKFDRAAVREVVTAVGLPKLADRLDDTEHWNRMLSLGEQQRLGIARALLHRPEYLLLDEATASLDEPSEAKLYELLNQRLPDAAIVSIGHRSTLRAFHDRGLELAREADAFRLRETPVPKLT
jgi:vitamin B12/bleomycin/antimicrobial peptide transport system ATP-binding/permease protein